MIRKLLLPCLTLALLFGTTACTHEAFFGSPIIEVNNSGLNYVQIFYQASPRAPRMRCDMRSNGQISVLEGHSATVGDDFNIDVSGTNLTDIRKYAYVMNPNDFRELLQALVNMGLLRDERTPREEDMPPEKVMVKGRINGRKIDKWVFDPEMIAVLKMEIDQFKVKSSR